MMSGRSQPPNIVWFILDALRAKNMSMYGYHRKTTPHLDAFARESVLFRHAFVDANWSIPSHTSMLTGLYMAEHHLDNMRGNTWLNDQIRTIPEILGQFGYRTACFSQNVLFNPHFHFDLFEEFYQDETWLSRVPLSRLLKRLESAAPGMKWRALRRYIEEVTLPRLTLKDIQQWIGRVGPRQPFLVMCNLMTMHNSWGPPFDLLLRNLDFNIMRLLDSSFVVVDPFRYNSGLLSVTDEHRKVWLSLYNAALQHLDRELGRFLAWLKRWAGWEHTIVVITADHGEMLGDYRNLVNHMLSLHDNLIHVPLIVRHPGFPSGLVVEGVVQPMDLFSSVLEWVDVPTGEYSVQRRRPSLTVAMRNPTRRTGYAFAECDYTGSHSLLDALKNINPDFDTSSFPSRQIAARSISHKYIWTDTQSDEFYDITTDPGERHNLVDRSPAMAEYRQLVADWQASLQDYSPQVMGQEDRDTSQIEQRLRALGYIA